MKTSRIIALILVIAAAIAAVNIFLTTPVSVDSQKIKKQSYVPHISLSGTLEGSDYVVLAQSPAVIDSVLVKKGDNVSAGSVICTVNESATQAMAQLSDTKQEYQYYSDIVSNRDGKVLSVSVKSGETVDEGDSIIKLSCDGAMQVLSMVSESNISDIRVGQKAEITGVGFKGKSYSATVCKIGDTAKKVTLGTTKVVAVEVFLSIDEPDSILKEGYSAKAKIFTNDETQLSVVPYSAVLQDDKGEYVYKIMDKKAVLTRIKTGKELSSGYEILSGLSQNDTVILNPQKIKRNNCLVDAKEKGAK